MDFLVVSDIHGSADAMEKIITIYNKGRYHKIVICGDILYHGARNPLPEGHNPGKLADILNVNRDKIIMVKGNCDSDVDDMVLDFPSSGNYSYILTKKRDIFVTHGDSYSPSNLPPLAKKSVFLSGHTHIPKGDLVNDIFCFNPGSISLPKGGFKASYGVLTPKKWSIYELDSKIEILSTSF